MSKRKYTRDDGKNIYEGMEDSQILIDSDSPADASTTESQDSGESEIVPETDYTECVHCGSKLISYEEAERITRSEAASFVELHAGKLIELETIKFLAKERKLNGPKALRGPKRFVAKKKK